MAGDARLPAHWPAEPPAPLWRAYVGEGYSSPVVKDGRVFIMGREARGLEACLCFSAKSGKQLWRHAYPAPYKPPDMSAGQGPKSTPTVDRDQVYMIGIGGMLHCFDVATGFVRWKHDCAAEYWGVEKDPAGDDAWFPACGSAASALVVADEMIFPVGGKKAGAFAAFDRRSGAIAWNALTDRGSYGSPMLVELAGVRQIVGFTGKRMVGVSMPGGELLWDYPFPIQFDQTVLTPVIWKDRVIVGGEKKATVALRIERRDDQLNPSTAWRSAELQAYLTTPVVFDDHLLGLDDRRKVLVCIDLETGKTAWTSPNVGRYVSLVVAGKHLLALNSEGELHVLEANPRQFVPLAKWTLSDAGDTWSHLAVVGSRLYVKDKEHLMCFELSGAR